MIQTLVQYFIKNGHLDIPGIGILKWSKQSSYWEQNKFIAPKEFIELEVTPVTASKQFYSYLAEELNLTIEQANFQYDAFIQQFMGQKMASMNFGHLGTLLKNESVVSWNNLYNADIYYKDLALETAVLFENDETSFNSKKEYWHIWAFIILFIGVALIFYKFY